MNKYTYTANGRTWKLYGCAKYGCDHINLDYESFRGPNNKSYCLAHIPLRLKFILWWHEEILDPFLRGYKEGRRTSQECLNKT
jgi:hypothetical protein